MGMVELKIAVYQSEGHAGDDEAQKGATDNITGVVDTEIDA